MSSLTSPSGKDCPFHQFLAISFFIVPPLLLPPLRKLLNTPPPCPSPNLDHNSPVSSAVSSVLAAVSSCSKALRSTTLAGAKAGSTNTSGDDQLSVDLLTDALSFASLRSCADVKFCISEETPTYVSANEGGTVAVSFDPLDGSSIMGPNFAVGGIYALWPVGSGEDDLQGRKGDEALASVVAVYGSRTTAFVSVKGRGCSELTLTDGGWTVTRPKVEISSAAKIFAPGNLRATKGHPGYKRAVDMWIAEGYTLRYTGGMVPDVCHILSKGGGVFSNVATEGAKQKLR